MKEYQSRLFLGGAGWSSWLAAGVCGSMIWGNYRILAEPPDYYLIAGMAWVTFFIYRLNQWVSFHISKVTDSSLENKKRIFIESLIKVGIYVIPGGVLVLTRMSFFSMIVLGCGFIISLAYSYPVLGKEWRTVPGIKTLVLAMIWTLATGLPWLKGIEVPWGWWVSRCLFFTLNGLIFDWRDQGVDAYRKVQTLPLVIGLGKFRVLFVLILISWISIDIMYWPGYCATWLYALLLLPPLGVSLPKAYYHFIDASIIVYGLT